MSIYTTITLLSPPIPTLHFQWSSGMCVELKKEVWKIIPYRGSNPEGEGCPLVQSQEWLVEMCIEEMGRVYWGGPKRCLGEWMGWVWRLDESVWSEEWELEGETRESEVWGKGETVEGVSTKTIFDEFGDVWEVWWVGVSVGLEWGGEVERRRKWGWNGVSVWV